VEKVRGHGVDRLQLVIAILVVGLALGLFSHASSSLPGAWRWVGNFGALWLAIAFFVGRASPNPWTGAAFGALSLTAASVMHYVPRRMVHEGVSLHAFRWPVILWVLVGLATGLLFGALGSAHARRLRIHSTIGVALLVAAFAAEALVLFRIGHDRAVQVAVPIEAVAALALPLTLMGSWKERVTTYAVAAAMVPLLAFALASFMGVIHRVYPGI
jgi:hypothetical protein